MVLGIGTLEWSLETHGIDEHYKTFRLALRVLEDCETNLQLLERKKLVAFVSITMGMIAWNAWPVKKHQS